MTKTVTKITMSLMRIECRDLKPRQEELSMLTRGLDKLIQYSDFIQDERLRLYLSDSEKNGVTVKFHRACQKRITNKIKRKGEIVSTTSKKIRRVRGSDVTEFSWKTHFPVEDLRVFQCLNILNVKKSETFGPCLSSRVY